MLEFSYLTAHLEFNTPMELPYWMGSTFRGGFGIYLRKACCPNTNRDCHTCPQKDRCIFYHCHMKTESKHGHAPPPKPITIIPPFYGKTLSVQENGYLDIDILLLGQFAQYIPHTVLALRLLGQAGLGDKRHIGINRYTLTDIECRISKRTVYDGQTVKPQNMKTIDIQELKPIPTTRNLAIQFRTPFVSKTGSLPKTLDRLTWHIRQRVIHYVNEYGDTTRVPDYEIDAQTTQINEQYCRLARRSTRSGEQEYHAHTGVIKHRIARMNRTARWLLKTGQIIGAGPKASFGCGHIQIDNTPTKRSEPDADAGQK
jgi:hypothetical protein